MTPFVSVTQVQATLGRYSTSHALVLKNGGTAF